MSSRSSQKRLPIDSLEWWKYLFGVSLTACVLLSVVVLTVVWLFLHYGKDELLMSFLISVGTLFSAAMGFVIHWLRQQLGGK
ncbi:MAG: hypothetical protein L0211_14240 [Planctomycetaceae bacterium]|nr:hypothetical protein [Planctomycetaceae bacterium]